jgi:hypothetical protein
VPSKKQRRRRQKGRRHEYEYVYVDEEGREIEGGEEEEEAAPAPRSSAGRTKSPAKAAGGRGGRTVEPPSWRRVGRRALLLGPVLFLLMFLLKPKDANSGAIVVQALFFLLIFLPFSYMMDSMLYRNYMKRTGQAPVTRGRGAKEPKPKS